MAKRYFEFSEGSSNKFWEVWCEDSKVFTRYGKIGASGQITVKDEGSDDAALKLESKLVREKTGKGYVEKGGSGAPKKAAVKVAVKKTAVKVAKKVSPPPAAAAAPKTPAGAIRLEFTEGGSSKFWQIVRTGDAFTVTFGKIGTPGQEQKKKFSSEWEARREHDKLVEEKKKKGYAPVLLGAAPSKPTTSARNEELEAAILKSPEKDDGFLVYADWLQGQGDVRGELATLQGQLAKQKKKDKKLGNAEAKLLWEHRGHFFGPLATYFAQTNRSYGASPIEATWRWGFIDELVLSAASGWKVSGPEGEISIPTVRNAAELIRCLPKVASARFVRDLVIACPIAEDEFHFEESVKALAKVVPELPLLRRLTLGRFTYEDSELSWSYMGKLDALWPALEKLEFLKIRVGSMTMGSIALPALKELWIETGGLSRKSLQSIIAMKAPQLETLNLWFGQDDYGCDCDASDVAELLSSTAFPKLKHLGLANTTFGNELVPFLVKSKLMKQIETLDLSMSHLTVEGMRELVAGKAAFPKLQELDVAECLLNKEGVKLAKTMAKIVESGDQEDVEEYQEEDYRYSAVGE
ncbi:MAG: WGR domain-containing protein [Archangium sp.]